MDETAQELKKIRRVLEDISGRLGTHNQLLQAEAEALRSLDQTVERIRRNKL